MDRMWPGITKNATCGDAYKRLSDLWDGAALDIYDGDRRADGVKVMVLDNAADLAYADVAPSLTGHLMAVGDEITWTSRYAITRMWIKNNVAGSNAKLVITPLFNL